MKVKLEGIRSKQGIYRIINEGNGKIYVGSTYKFGLRANAHVRCLQQNNHANWLLQQEYNIWGKTNFVFEAIEMVEGGKEELLSKEQEYIDMYFDNQQNCYNANPSAHSRLGSKNLRPFNPETDGRAVPASEEKKAFLSKINTIEWNKPERKLESSMNVRKRWEGHSADIVVTNVFTNETVHITGSLKGFCEDRGLYYGAVHLMAQGKTKISEGWFLGTEKPVYVDRRGEKRKPMTMETKIAKSDTFWEGIVIVNVLTQEEIVLGKHIKSDCSDELSYHQLRRLLKGYVNFTRTGWCLKENKEKTLQKIVATCKKCGMVFIRESSARNHKRNFHPEAS